MDKDLHWSDPEFLEWERDQVGEFHSVEKYGGFHNAPGETLRFFWCYRPDSYFQQPGRYTNFQGLMFSFKGEFTESDAMTIRDPVQGDL